MNEEGLKVAIKESLNENSHLQESQKHLLQEAKVWKEKVSDLNKQKITFEDSKIQAEQVLHDKENHIKSLTECLLKMKDQAPVLGEDLTDDGNLELEMKNESEIGAHLDNQPKEALEELVYAAECQICTLLSEVDETKEDLIESIKNLQTEQESLQSENTQFENENQKLQQKFKVKMEQYQENAMKRHRKLRVEEECQLEEEERFSEVDKKISRAAEELETYRRQVKNLEELDATIHYYQRQSISYEKKARDALAAWSAEKNLKYLKIVNAHNRQKLTEMEFKFKLLEEDLYALNVSNTAFGRELPLYGPSPLVQSSSPAALGPCHRHGNRKVRG
uniref:Uncharacterized protein n=1 Tax=Sciurus vulgaris TaxID=55149 RepID=A0A8D2DLU3_SCIVU